MLLERQRLEVIDTGLKMCRCGLVRSTAGNISVRDPETGYIAIKPSSVDYDKITPESVTIIDEWGKVIEGNFKPSSETPLHTAIYRSRPDVSAIVHTHSLYATAFSAAGREIPCVLATEGEIGIVPIAAWAPPGSEELGLNVVEALRGKVACVLDRHGPLAVGSSLQQAFGRACSLEDAAQVAFLAEQLGGVRVFDQPAAPLQPSEELVEGTAGPAS